MSKIIQIIPASNDVWAIYKNEGKQTGSKIQVIVLDDLGDIGFQDACSSGSFMPCEENSNFVTYFFGPKEELEDYLETVNEKTFKSQPLPNS